MKEKLIIRNFGPIKEVDLDLGKVTVLIGEQATGKSTVTKVLAVCRYFSYIVETGAFDDQIDGPFLKGLKAWGLSEFLQPYSYIQYDCKHYAIKVGWVYDSIKDPNGIKTEYSYNVFKPILNPKSHEFINLLLELEKIKPKEAELDEFELGQLELGAEFWTIPTSFFLNDVKKVMDNPFYFPTQRGLQSIFDIGQSSIRNLSNSLFTQLSRLDGIARLFKQETYIEPLDIYYVNRDGHGFIRKANEEQYYSLYNAASGYQAIIPIVLVVKYYTELKKKTKTLIIEEPELDVFPTAQNKLIQYLCEKAKSYDSMVFMTTHSPYTITSLNNLMYAYQVGQEHPEEVSKEIDKKYWINPDDVSCYRMLNDGKCRNIIDSELKQIDAGEIDEVSRFINEKWDRLSNIMYKSVS